MNIVLWVLQVLLALHTATGAVWKFSNTEEAASLAALPHGVWMALAVLEVAVAVVLVLPAVGRSLGVAVPVAAAFIVAAMLLFCVVNLASGSADTGSIIYWLVVAVLAGFLAWGRFAAWPIR